MPASTAIRSALLPRQVHVYMRPVPRNLQQSLLVVEELQKFGEVATFRNFQHDFRPNVRHQSRAAVAIFESADAAEKAISTRTLYIPMNDTDAKELEPEDQNAEDGTMSSNTDIDYNTDTGSGSGSENNPSHPRRMICTLHRSEYDHESTVRENPYHDAFKPSGHWYEFQDLMRNYDRKMNPAPLAELADCFVFRKRRMPLRLQSKLKFQNESSGDTSLMELWRKGNQRRTEGPDAGVWQPPLPSGRKG